MCVAGGGNGVGVMGGQAGQGPSLGLGSAVSWGLPRYLSLVQPGDILRSEPPTVIP